MAFPLIPPKSQWVDGNGDPLVGGSLEFLDPSTGLQKDIYSTADDADVPQNPNTNPVVLDARGEAAIFLEDGESYKVILRDADDIVLWTVDDVATAPGQTAAGVTITDTGGYYTANTVEAAFAEIGAATGAGIIGLADGAGNYSSTDVEGALAELGNTTGAGIVRIVDSGSLFAATNVEDALQELVVGGLSVVKAKAVTQDVGSSTTLVDDDDLQGWTLENAKDYAIEGFLECYQNAGNIKLNFSFSSSPTNLQIKWTAITETPTPSATVDIYQRSSTAVAFTTLTDDEIFGISITGRIGVAAASTMSLQWAQETSAAAVTSVRSGWIRVTKVR